MLFDPKWHTPSLAGFIGWLETQNPRRRYNYENCQGECLLGQYMAAMGIEWGETPATINGHWSSTNYIKTANQIFGSGAILSVLSDRPWTFGSALKRARKLVSPL